LGSIAYAGLIIGSMVATGLFQKGDLIKPTLAISLCGNVISLLLFTTTSSFYIILFYRGLIGFF
jgi:hypothetical protein